MIKASELKSMEVSLTASEEKVVEHFEKLILAAHRNKEKRVLYYNPLTPPIIDHLRRNEYKVEEETDRDGFLGIISWQ